ncbi:hypothetical protein ACHAWO_005416 [Cyclotella atomus]|uniref:Uncharacterized protein n=1 Tax=Cyclotella atomus TaxID=382360 RepID=A0ABD3QE38_9STRA
MATTIIKDHPITPDDPKESTNESSSDTTTMITPAFQMKDVSTTVIERRSPSPSILTSRRGRSRSPVAVARPNSRGFNREGSAGFHRDGATIEGGEIREGGDISQAAIAAGAAAIAAKRGPSPYTAARGSPSPARFPDNDRSSHDHPDSRAKDRSPSRSGSGHRYDHSRYYQEDTTTVNKWPSASFECSPIQYNLSLGSFDWGNGVAALDSARPSPAGEARHHNRYNESGRHQDSRYPEEDGRSRYNLSPSPERRYDPYHHEERRYHHHHPRDEYRYYEGGRYYDYRHESSRYSGSSSRYHHPHATYRKESSSRRRSSSQPLYSEHHILSTSTYEDDPTTNSYGRQSFRDAPTPTADNSRNHKSVFRGVKDDDVSGGVGEYKSNVVTALRDVESPTTTAAAAKAKVDAKQDKTKSKEKKKGKRVASATKKKKKEQSLPKELLLDNDEDNNSINSPTNSPSAPSPTNIDKELSAIGIDNLDALHTEVDYLGNLSFRKSYDLEQMFSFMKSPKGSMKDDGFKFGSMSFTNSFLMSASGEEKEMDTSMMMPNHKDLKMRSSSHRRNPSYGPPIPRRSSRSSPLFHQQGVLPTIHTLSSQSMGNLTPIHSFGDEHNPIVPLTSHDGMALTAMFAASPVNLPEGQGCVDGEAEVLSNNGGVQQQQHRGPPPGYSAYPAYRDHCGGSRGVPPPPQVNNAPPHGPIPAIMGPNKRIKMLSVGPHTLPTMDLSKRADLYVLLKRLAPAFSGFQFKLPEVDLPLSSYDGSYLPTDQQLTIAKRRVHSSLCVFGGSVPRRTVSFESDAELTPSQKKEKDEKAAYENDLSSRYFLKEHCISWDVELHDVIVHDRKTLNSSKGGKDSNNYCAPVTPSTPNNHNLNGALLGIREKGKKVKYRCKLCGQPKQNHTCPYQSTVMRSIGTMVYPAVNAFVSDEPGKLAPPLSEMNNFTTLLSQDMSVNTQNYRPYNTFNVLTPDSHWSPNTPGAMSAISTASTPNRKRDHLLMSRTMSGVSTGGGGANDDSLFRGIMELKPEQYRRVRFKVDRTEQEDAYRYPHIPTPYSQRKEMGDTLFALSREVPKLADSCAAILRSARENDCWDQAVAELTTQVLIVLKCEEQDYALEGLKRHLLTLGIAC